MGDDGSWAYSTVGYMEIGQIPSFRVFDASENAYYDAVASEDIPWVSTDFNILDDLNVVPDCNGDLGGDALVDDCGDCSSPDDFNSGQDDCGVCYGENADMDCAGECFGDHWESD